MLTINEILKSKMSDKLIHKKCKNIDLTFLFPQLETYIEVLNNMEIEFEYSLYFNKTTKSVVIYDFHDEEENPNTYENNFDYLLYSSGIIPFTYFRELHKDSSNNSIYYFDTYKPYLVFTLHFPKFIIKNKLNHKTEIKDFFLRFYIDQTGFIKDGNLEASRTTYTNGEIKAGYRHSHLPSVPRNTEVKSQLVNFVKMCLGTNTQIHAAMAHLQNAVSSNENVADFFELFIRNIISVIEYESIEGTPYIRMEKIKEALNEVQAKSTPYNVYYTATNYVINYLTNLYHHDIDYPSCDTYLKKLYKFLYYYNDADQIEFNEESEYIIFDSVISNHLASIKIDSNLKQYIKVEVNNRLLNLDETEIVSNATTDNYFVEFNNKKYYLTIDDTVKLEPDNFKYVFSPIFKNYVKQIIKTRYLSSIINHKKGILTISGDEGDSANPPF
jgi:hypothetical protein